MIGFVFSAGGKRAKTLLDGAKGDWTVTSQTEAASNYTTGHDDAGLFLERSDASGADIVVTVLCDTQVDFSRISQISVDGVWGTESGNNPPMELMLYAVADGETVSSAMVSCAGGAADAVPQEAFSGVLDVSELSGWGTVSLRFFMGQYYGNPSMIRANRIVLS